MRIISLITPSISLCICLSSFSIQPICNQNIASNIKSGKVKVSVILVSCLKITILTSSIVSILMIGSFPIYKYLFENSYIYYPLLASIPLIYISNFSGIIKGYLEANNIFKTTYLANVFESLAKIIFSIILLFIFRSSSLNTQVLTIFISLSLSEVVSCIILTSKIKKHVNRPVFEVKTDNFEHQIFKEALPLTLEGLVSTASSYVMPFIFYFAALKNNIDFHTSTTYYALVTSYSLPLLISGQFAILTLAKLIFPNISKNIENPKVVYKILDSSLIIGLFLSVICFCFCYFYSDFGLKLLFGNTFGKDTVVFMAPLFFFIYFDPLLVIVLQAYKKGRILFYSSLISQIVSIVLIYLLTINPNIGLIGYTYGITIGLLLKFVLLLSSTLLISKYKPNLKIFLNYILLSLIYLLVNLITKNIILFFISTIFFSFLYLLLLKVSRNKK